MVQRMLTCKNAAKGGRSAITAILIAIPIVALFLLIGLLLFVFYKQPALMVGVTPKVMPAGDQQPFLVFIVNELPTGLAGLMVAGLFAVGLGSLNSAINAMAATFIRDFYSHWFPGRSDKHYLSAGRWAVVGWGVVLGGFAIFCIYWKRANPQDTLIDFALRAMTFAFAGLLAVFLTVLLTRRGSGPSAIAALITGFVVILLFQTPFCVAVSSALTITKYDAQSIKTLLPWLSLPWPWHLPIGVALSMGVCCLGRPRSPAVPA
jgi:Na+/proline symporter